MCSREHRNVIEAAFVGASQAIPLVLNIGGNLIAFLSLLAAINGFLGWFGGLLDYPQLSFEVRTVRLSETTKLSNQSSGQLCTNETPVSYQRPFACYYMNMMKFGFYDT